MKTGLNLVELATKIEASKGLKKDFIASTKSEVRMVVPTGTGVGAATPVLEIADHGEFPILPLPHKQIGTFTKIPADYYDRMLTTDPNLLATNVNAWFDRAPKKRMIRTLGGNARGWLSNQYQRIEHEEIAAAALPVLYDLPNVQIVSSEITDRKLYIHFVVPSIQGEVKVGDVVQVGGIIQNSEVGLGSVSVSGLIWRLICLNGAKTGDTFRRNHVGRKIEDSEELWADDTKKSDDRTVLLKVRDMVRAIVDETRFRTQLDTLRGLTEGKISGNPAKAVEVLSRKVGVTEDEHGGILRALIEGSDLSRWGIVNAVTAQAHTAKTYDRAVEFEAMGGDLINLAANDWNEILQAA